MDNDDALLPKKNVISANWKIGKKENDNKVVLLTKQVQQQKTLPSMYNKNRRR